MEVSQHVETAHTEPCSEAPQSYDTVSAPPLAHTQLWETNPASRFPAQLGQLWETCPDREEREGGGAARLGFGPCSASY